MGELTVRMLQTFARSKIAIKVDSRGDFFAEFQIVLWTLIKKRRDRC